MSLSADLFSALKSLVGNRVNPINLTQPNTVPTWPAIYYSFISIVPIVDLCGDGDDTTADYRVQLDVCALTFKACEALRLQVMAAMIAAFPTLPAIADGRTATLLNSTMTEFESRTQTYRATLDYAVSGSSASGNSPP